MMTTELKAYAAQIVIQRGITADQMTPALMGEVLRSALRNMDAAAIKVMDSRAVQRALAADIWATVRAA